MNTHRIRLTNGRGGISSFALKQGMSYGMGEIVPSDKNRSLVDAGFRYAVWAYSSSLGQPQPELLFATRKGARDALKVIAAGVKALEDGESVV